MVFAKQLREGIRQGEITRTVRIWQRCHVKVAIQGRGRDHSRKKAAPRQGDEAGGSRGGIGGTIPPRGPNS
jgi:hypothetical protein